ncbi:hypothetical protein [Helicobacter suis]|nr:hypothetical protein [Helicobacter suis]
MGFNATYSNLNQIARHLNMNAFAGDGIHEALLKLFVRIPTRL